MKLKNVFHRSGDGKHFLKERLAGIVSAESIRGAAFFLGVFFLIAGTDLFCAIRMAGKKTFLTMSEVEFRSGLSIGLAILLFFVYLILLAPETVPLWKRCVRVIIPLSPLFFVLELFNYILVHNSEVDVRDFYTFDLLPVKILLLILYLVLPILIFTVVAAVSTEEEIGPGRGLLLLLKHFPVAFFWLLVWILIEAVLIITDLAYFTGIFGTNGTFYMMMAWRLTETVLVALIAWFLTVSMKKRTQKWQSDKKEKSPKESSHSTLMLIMRYVPLVLLIPTIILAFVSGSSKKQDLQEPILADIDYAVLQGMTELQLDELATAAHTMQMARDKIDAWKAYAEDDVETIAGILEKRKSDPTIWRLYVKVADDGVDQLEHYVLTEGLGDTGARAALLEAYEGLNSKKMTTVRKGYRSELLMNFMVEESFVSGFSEIPKVKEAKKLIKTLEEAYGTISAYQEMIAVLDSAGRIGEVDTKVMSRAMEIAEQNEDDAILQYLAAYIVAAGAADGREYYYQRAVPLVVSFLELSANDKKISDEELALRQTSAIELLTTLQGYQEIVDLIDEMDLDKEDEEAMGALRLFCLLNSGSSEEVYEAAAEMVDEGSEEPQIWYYYGVGALEQGDTDAMNEAMETIMEMVMDEDLSDKELLRAESALYIMIEYATLNESSILAKNNFYHTMSEREQKQYSPLLHSYLEAMDAYANGNDHYPDMDRYEYAKQQIDEVLEERDDLCFAWYLKGCICYRAQQFEEAIEYFEEALSYDPENIQILYALANAYDGAGDYENAYAISTQVEKLWPKKNHAEDPFGIGFHNPNLKNRLEPYVNGGDE